MSNYSIVTNYLSKDTLTSGNPLKLVKGADLTTEFTAVQVAVNSKVDGGNVVIPAPGTGTALTVDPGAGSYGIYVAPPPSGTTVPPVRVDALAGGPSIQCMDQTGNLYDVGWRDIPVNIQNGTYTVTPADRGKCIYKTAGASNTVTIPSGLPVGTSLTFSVRPTNSALLIACAANLYWAPTGNSGTRTLAAAGMATALQVESGTWIISGYGIT